MNILIIEDDPVDRKLAGAVLSTGGHSISETTSAEEAMQSIAQSKPDVILVDLRLPGMDGATLVRALRADPETRGIPVVAVTSFPEPFGREEMLAAGCDAYFVKPIDTRSLPHQIKAVTERRLQKP